MSGDGMTAERLTEIEATFASASTSIQRLWEGDAIPSEALESAVNADGPELVAEVKRLRTALERAGKLFEECRGGKSVQIESWINGADPREEE